MVLTLVLLIPHRTYRISQNTLSLVNRSSTPSQVRGSRIGIGTTNVATLVNRPSTYRSVCYQDREGTQDLPIQDQFIGRTKRPLTLTSVGIGTSCWLIPLTRTRAIIQSTMWFNHHRLVPLLLTHLFFNCTEHVL